MKQQMRRITVVNNTHNKTKQKKGVVMKNKKIYTPSKPDPTPLAGQYKRASRRSTPITPNPHYQDMGEYIEITVQCRAQRLSDGAIAREAHAMLSVDRRGIVRSYVSVPLDADYGSHVGNIRNDVQIYDLDDEWRNQPLLVQLSRLLAGVTVPALDLGGAPQAWRVVAIPKTVHANISIASYAKE